VIVCISANPAIDRRLYLNNLQPGHIHRATSAVAAAGGKAAHVSLACRALGEDVTWIGLVGGSSGAECVAGLNEAGIETIAITTKAATRTNVELIEQGSGRVTEIREPGQPVEPYEIDGFVQRCREVIDRSPSATYVMSGSLPPGARPDLYAELIRSIHAAGGAAFLDTSGEPLALALAARPDLIKPNRDEAGDLVNIPIDDTNAQEAAHALIDRGAQRVALSLGAEGLLFQSSEGEAWRASSATVHRRSSVGCGDAALAGLAVAWKRGAGTEDMIRLAVACGAANCRAVLPGMIRKEEVARLRFGVNARQISVPRKGSSSHAG
jgi:1-phosphofructokinase family hexose kinase